MQSDPEAPILKPNFDKYLRSQRRRISLDSLVGYQQMLTIFVFKKTLRLGSSETNGDGMPILAALLNKSLAASKGTAFKLVKKVHHQGKNTRPEGKGLPATGFQITSLKKWSI